MKESYDRFNLIRIKQEIESDYLSKIRIENLRISKKVLFNNYYNKYPILNL